MNAAKLEELWSELAGILEAEPDAPDGVEALLHAADELAPDAGLGDLRLPVAEDLEHLELWLLGQLESAVPFVEALWFRVRLATRYGRVDGCDLELYAGPPSSEFARKLNEGHEGSAAGSAALERLVARTSHLAATGERELVEQLLPVGVATLLAQASIDRLDPRLVLAGCDLRGVTVGLDGGPGVDLGRRTERGWSRERVELFES